MRYLPPKKRFPYGELIKDSFEISWKYRFLWFFGLFAGGYSGGGGGNFNTGGSFDDFDGSNGGGTGTDISNWFYDNLALIIGIAIALIVLVILVFLWSVICRGAVIGSVRDVREGRQISFKSAFHRGRESFVRLLLYDLFLLVVGVCLFIIILALVLFIIFMIATGVAGAVILSILSLWVSSWFVIGLGFLACCGLIFFFAIPFALFLNLAVRAVVLEGAGPVEALGRAWQLSLDNLGQGLLVSVIAYGLSFVAGLAMFLVVGLVSIPAIFAWIAAAAGDFNLGGIILASLLSLLPLVALLIVTAAMNTYFTTYWTIAYRKLTGDEDVGGTAPAAYYSPTAPAGYGPQTTPAGPWPGANPAIAAS